MNNAEHTKLMMAETCLRSDDEKLRRKGMEQLAEMLKAPPAPEKETRNFRWAYMAVVALARRNLRQMNDEREYENDWPAGQEWEGLAGSSKSIFMRKAREEAGIPHEEFLAGIRSGEYDVDDLFE